MRTQKLKKIRAASSSFYKREKKYFRPFYRRWTLRKSFALQNVFMYSGSQRHITTYLLSLTHVTKHPCKFKCQMHMPIMPNSPSLDTLNVHHVICRLARFARALPHVHERVMRYAYTYMWRCMAQTPSLTHSLTHTRTHERFPGSLGAINAIALRKSPKL